MTPDELQIDLVRLVDGRRVVRITHLATGITVEDDPSSPKSIIDRRRALERRLADLVTRSPPRGSPAG